MKVEMVTVVMVTVVMVTVVMVNGVSGEDRYGRQRARRDDKVPREFAEWHTYNELFLAHIGTPPSQLDLQQLKPKLNTLLGDLHFLPKVNEYLDTHLANVSSETEARVIFTLMDLFSAQEPHRHRYLDQMRNAFVQVFQDNPGFGRPTVSYKFFLDGFDRHLRQMKHQTRGLYRRLIVPDASNLDLVAYYWPGQQPSLDRALTQYGLPAPFLVMKEGQWYNILQADPPHLSLSVHLSTWRLTLANHTLRHTLFRFEEVQVSFGAVRYLLRNAVLPTATHLSFPCRRDALCFDYQRAARVEVVVLAGGEVAIIHKRGSRALFLHLPGHDQGRGAQQGRASSIPEPRLHHRYPGRSAHWLLVPRS